MGAHSSDVNTIFAYTDIRHKFYRNAVNYFDKTKQDKYILLKHVYTTFFFTYSENLKRIGDMIIKSINKVKINLSERRLKSPPSEVLKNIMLKKELDHSIVSQKEQEFNPTDYDYYKNILLKDYPLIELLNNEKMLEEFDSFYVKAADEITRNKLKEFISSFKNIEKLPKLDRNKVMGIRNELKEIKSEHHDIFSSPDDEDIRLSAELLTFCSLRRTKLNFATSDQNLVKSLNFVKKKFNCGEIVNLLEGK